MTLAGLTIIAEGEGYLFALWRNLYVLDFRTTPTLAGLHDTVRAKKVAIEQSPEGLVVLNFLAPGPIPSSDVRQLASEVQHADTEGTICHATVVESTGFSGSAMRSVLTGLMAFGRTSYPRKVFGDSDEALLWQAGVSKARADWMSGARQVVRELRLRRF